MGSVRIMMQFLDFSHPEIPYMYHCHMLTHEDGGMMGQFRVLDPAASVGKAPTDPACSGGFSPNPAEATVDVRWPDGDPEVRVFSMTGQEVLAGPRSALGDRWDVSHWPAGVYLARFGEGGAGEAVRLVVE
jgi:hypothetical protein